MIAATFVPWWQNGSDAMDDSLDGGVSGWELFRAFGVTYNPTYSMPSGQGDVLWTGIVTLLVGIVAVILGIWLATRFDISRGTRSSYTRVVGTVGLLLGLAIGVIEAVAFYQQFSTQQYELVYTSGWPSFLMLAATCLLVGGLFIALRAARSTRGVSASDRQWTRRIAIGVAVMLAAIGFMFALIPFRGYDLVPDSSAAGFQLVDKAISCRPPIVEYWARPAGAVGEPARSSIANTRISDFGNRHCLSGRGSPPCPPL